MSAKKSPMFWAGWVLAALIAALLIFSASGKFTSPPEVEKMFFEKFGYSKDLFVPIGIAEITCLIIFLIPQTAVLGAILLTGYLGGAIATHVRVHDNFIPPAVAGVCVWLSLFFRDPRLRALIPLRRSAAL